MCRQSLIQEQSTANASDCTSNYLCFLPSLTAQLVCCFFQSTQLKTFPLFSFVRLSCAALQIAESWRKLFPRVWKLTENQLKSHFVCIHKVIREGAIFWCATIHHWNYKVCFPLSLVPSSPENVWLHSTITPQDVFKASKQTIWIICFWCYLVLNLFGSEADAYWDILRVGISSGLVNCAFRKGEENPNAKSLPFIKPKKEKKKQRGMINSESIRLHLLFPFCRHLFLHK